MQDAALSIALLAIANSDHEFGLEVCKRAGSVMYDPRICSMMGECYELKGDMLEAICAYRAALTMSSNLGRTLPPEAPVPAAPCRSLLLPTACVVERAVIGR